MGSCSACKDNTEPTSEIETFDEHSSCIPSGQLLSGRCLGSVEVLHNVALVSRRCKIKLSTDKGKVRLKEVYPNTTRESQAERVTNHMRNEDPYNRALKKASTMKSVRVAKHKAFSKNDNDINYNNFKEEKKVLVNTKSMNIDEGEKIEELKEEILIEASRGIRKQETKVDSQSNDNTLNAQPEFKLATSNFMKTLSEGIFNIIKMDTKETLKSDKISEVVFDLKNLRLENRKIQAEKYKRMSVIGKGTFGQVYKIMHVGTKKIYAMKVVNKSKCLDPSNILNEIEILKTLVYFTHA
eukprot:TRINITY_DN7935_c0_g1_i2.p1 TRINITY_DN7935_c0_g1~~TRINITY_DN7935_c0_g1_i2.p1  ORF type:complete len:297 (-),score=73.79 TRINITY_DN7935_c0_g1_i2:1444-2334(-)